jgi:hypothetical protein
LEPDDAEIGKVHAASSFYFGSDNETGVQVIA